MNYSFWEFINFPITKKNTNTCINQKLHLLLINLNKSPVRSSKDYRSDIKNHWLNLDQSKPIHIYFSWATETIPFTTQSFDLLSILKPGQGQAHLDLHITEFNVRPYNINNKI